jgi:hypothetical protein
MRKIFVVFLTFLIALHSLAQAPVKNKKEERRERIDSLVKQQEEGVITYKKHTAVGLKLITSGYGAFFELGRAQSIRRTLLYQLEISELKDPEESKDSYPGLSLPPFIFGKINFVYPIKLGVQQQFLLGNKSNKNGVSVTANFGGGISIALLRPYYVVILDSPSTKLIKYNSPDSLSFIDPSLVVGGPTLGQGWSELSVTPGLYMKAAMRFDYGRFNQTISAVEVGITGEYYSKKIPQMVYEPEKQFFFSGYLSMIFGGRK